MPSLSFYCNYYIQICPQGTRSITKIKQQIIDDGLQTKQNAGKMQMRVLPTCRMPPRACTWHRKTHSFQMTSISLT